MRFCCAHCGKTADKPSGHVNRARQRGLNLYCNRRCSGFGRRQGKTAAQKREEKRLYDMEYRAKNLAMLKAKKHEYFVRTYDPAKAAIERKKRMSKHVEYCRQPWYKKWKSEYDARYRAKEFGAFADAYRLTIELNKEIKRRTTNEDLEASKYQDRRRNKRQSRQREAGQERRANRHSASLG